ncbi:MULTISPECIES: hypothetical protein [Rhizobium/Agrobacterium group]|uniref:hypothetical protein n=1 Tax=Rhizobium/Agrobacterium group TaxID=227290 RepID=UPI001ADA6D32|nr:MULTISPECIES: hypothetical protein [Rhizobium/Agrobacterium group]MBO9112731.1 hypothetical protein [Agrobacterium sp. S2/73]QXZ76217.1 hypothetical protein J5276_24950 [Agrobacterium sp. S7/73]QYA17235.1 hypothetical protein J5284_31765 [Rhizobium sp. AB2/73]UEQ85191.1 hypothetical protein I8E17_32290 [Rhizobium sp. AB2/73]
MTSKTTNKFSPEVRARAVRMVTEHEAEHPEMVIDRNYDCLSACNKSADMRQ